MRTSKLACSVNSIPPLPRSSIGFYQRRPSRNTNNKQWRPFFSAAAGSKRALFTQSSHPSVSPMVTSVQHGCQMAIAKFLDRMCLALRASGLWLRYATLQNLIPSFPWIAPRALHPGAIQRKEGIKFCHLAT